MNPTLRRLYRQNRATVTLIFIILVQAATIIYIGRNGVFHLVPVFLGYAQYDSTAQDLAKWHDIKMHEPQLGIYIQASSFTDESGTVHQVNNLQKPIGIMLVSGCKPCMASYLIQWSKVQKRHPDIGMYISTSSKDPQEIRDFKKIYGISSPFIIKGDEQLRSSLNPYFQPRIYLYDKAGQLAYIQAATRRTPDSLNDIDKLLSKQKGA